MTRKFAWWGFSFLLGLVLFSLDFGESFVALIISLLSAGTLVFIAFKKYRVYAFSVVACAVFGLLCGQAYTLYCYENIVSKAGSDVVLDGYITDFSYIGSDTCLITVKGRINGGKRTKITYFVENDDFDYYQRVVVSGKVKDIEDSIKFESQSYYRTKCVFLQGDGMPKVEISDENSNVLMREILRFRDRVSYQISQNVGEREGAFLVAMLCGDKSQLDNVTKTQLYKSGIGHVFSVSGMHLNIAVLFFGFLITPIISSKKIRFFITEIMIVAFVAFAGFSPSVVRAGIMLTAVISADVFRRRADALNSLGICCVIMCLINPYVVADPSFILSFAGAFTVGVIYPKISRIVGNIPLKNIVKSAIMVTLISLVTMPICAILFSEVSIISPLTNLILAPICTVALYLVLLSIILGGSGFLAVPILKLAGMVIGFVLKIVDWIVQLNFTTVGSEHYKVILFFGLVSLAGIWLTMHYKKIRIYIATVLAVNVGIFMLVQGSRLADMDKVHIVILPNGSDCTAVVYQNGAAFLLDLSSNGDLKYSVGQLFSTRDIHYLKGAFIQCGYYYSRKIYDENLFLTAENYFSDVDYADANLVNEGSTVGFSDMKISRTDSGYLVDVFGNGITVESHELLIDGKIFDYSEEEYPLEFVITDEDFEVRRLDYGYVKF